MLSCARAICYRDYKHLRVSYCMDNCNKYYFVIVDSILQKCQLETIMPNK